VETIGYALAIVLVLFACGAGLWNSVRIIKQKATTITASMALGESLPNVIYCAIGMVFLTVFFTTDWQKFLALTVAVATLLYIPCLWVYATGDQTSSKSFGVTLTCFHSIRCAALAVAITAAL